jgi:hypothetical protein
MASPSVPELHAEAVDAHQDVVMYDLHNEEGGLMANQPRTLAMNKRLVHRRGRGGRPGRGTVHTLDCSFLARRDRNEPGVLEEEYDEVDAADVSPTAPRCVFCTLKEASVKAP